MAVEQKLSGIREEPTNQIWYGVATVISGMCIQAVSFIIVLDNILDAWVSSYLGKHCGIHYFIFPSLQPRTSVISNISSVSYDSLNGSTLDATRIHLT